MWRYETHGFALEKDTKRMVLPWRKIWRRRKNTNTRVQSHKSEIEKVKTSTKQSEECEILEQNDVENEHLQTYDLCFQVNMQQQKTLSTTRKIANF
jgi:hypothetical protein